MSNQGKINVYICSCGAEMVTRDVDDGVTPFMTDCEKCGKFMQSSFYKVDQGLQPTHEWYRPGPEMRKKLSTSLAGFKLLRDHVDRGGLILREIGEGGA